MTTAINHNDFLTLTKLTALRFLALLFENKASSFMEEILIKQYTPQVVLNYA